MTLSQVDNTLERRDRILKQMYDDGKINLIDYRQALMRRLY